MLLKSIAFFAFFVLGVANAKPCKPGASVTSSDLSPSKTTTPTSGTTSASYDATPSLGYSGDICNGKNPAPNNRVCGAHGYITNHDGAWEFSLSAADLDSCADLCFRRTGCVTFSYMDSWCQLFSTQISNMGFSQDRKGPPFHELGCFNCVPDGHLVFNVDFSDSAIEDWTLITAEKYTFFFDIQRVKEPAGIMSNAVRILEATTSGRVELRHDPKVTLEAGGSYQIFISAQSKSTGNGSLGDDFGLLTIMLYNKNDRAFEAKPGKGIPLGMDWYSWQWSFSLDESQGGEYYFSILADASGLELDWYFDDIYIEVK
ncbi:hypothetical protein BKA56DRAFT_673329 [Ilyonectria sp. MPI-CAGE-AT-0026]|nr:hypothetical protein BKA56DRAFT_673329 [Ilyonectria sp. MPI-CAGE-AT-0026]